MTSELASAAVDPKPGRRLVDVIRCRCEFDGDACDALAAVADQPHPFALSGRWAGGGAIVGTAPRRLLRGDEDPFAALDDLPELRAGAPDAVGGGWFGFLGYRLGERLESLPPSPPRPASIPEFHLAYYDVILRQDPDGRWWLEALRDARGDADLDRRLAAFAERLRRPPAITRKVPEGGAGAFHVASPGHSGHRRAVSEAVERICAGDLFQVNLGLRLETRGRLDPVALYTSAARNLQPAYGAVFATDWGGVVSLSPELFLRRKDRHVVTGPIKGTVARPAGGGGERNALLTSGKDAAEHVMIVDLMRNDLGRVCEYGSVTRTENRRIEPHPGVWHLVSDVSGRMRDGVGDGDLVRASFPPGSVTGAPKVQSLRLISELEGSARELYTGALGFASPAAGLELSVAIRTFELAGDSAWLGAGGGIVADSRPESELAEALAKAQPLIAAIGGHIETEQRVSSGPQVSSLSRATRLVAAQRPDPALGVMETVLVRDGEPVALEAHLKRMSDTAMVVYGRHLPPELPDAARRRAAGADGVRLRLHVTPDGDDLAFGAELAPLPAAAMPVELVPVLLPGGLGAHKWRDRRLLEALGARFPGSVPLLIDGDGSVLEAAWGNVWLVVDGEHRTPALDGRLLPGITRAARLTRLVAQGVAVREVRIDLEDLGSGELYLTSSLRDVTPARVRTAASRPGSE